MRRVENDQVMLKNLTIRGFKSLRDVRLEFPRVTVLFGANAAGKSNLLDAIQALSRIGTQRTLADALSEPIRGHPIEAFSFPSGGLAELLSAAAARFSIGADLTRQKDTYRYSVDVEIAPGSGSMTVADEYLSALAKDGTPKGTAAIELVDGRLRLRRKSHPGKPRYEHPGQNYSILSDPRLGAPEYREIELARAELSDWRTYYLDPRVAMRAAQPPSDVRDIGVLGGDIAPFLYRIRSAYPKRFAAISRALRSIIPSIEEATVDLDKRRGTLDILIRQGGVDYSSRIVSEGTLRVLALCAIAVNPWGGSLLAFEEPENGVHPRRLELIAQLLLSLALEQERQVVVTTHSPLFCDAVLRGSRSQPDDIGLFSVRQEGQATAVQRFNLLGPLFKDQELAAALATGTEDGLFESLLLRGLLDG
jgi:predicted ATPase